QEEKEGLFDTVDTLGATLDAFCGMLGSIEVDEARMAAAAQDSSLLATDMADYLVGKGVAFRDAHAAVGALHEAASARGVGLGELSLEELRQQSPAFDADVADVTAQSSVAARDVEGGTAPSRVADALARARKRLEAGRRD
ncbi:MAG: argininosuccinate lyase, partial [Chloroflexi bacterium]|nr:argininosuccinate lyase [Chloroflexota bacterium]